MSSYGILCKDLSGAITYDSRRESTLFWLAQEVVLRGQNVSRTFSYPAYAGKKISASLISPYQTPGLPAGGDPSDGYGLDDGGGVLSCRVSYPSGIPTVTVFSDNEDDRLPMASNGLLSVFYTGALL